SEIANLVAGQVKSFLATRGVIVDLSLPVTIRGQSSEIRFKAVHPSVVFTFEDEHAALYIEACFDIMDVSRLAAPPVATAASQGAAI
ncbi:chemotaxis protein CheX, partial [Acinetobacter baumannii]